MDAELWTSGDVVFPEIWPALLMPPGRHLRGPRGIIERGEGAILGKRAVLETVGEPIGIYSNIRRLGQRR